MPKPDPAPATKAVAVGLPVWFYSDRKHGGMKSVDEAAPFAAIVASSVSDRMVNLLVVDHLGTTFPLQDVPLFQGDDKDDQSAPFHCELNAPAPRETIPLTGAAGQLIPLNIGSTIDSLVKEGAVLSAVKVSFTVPAGNAYTFSSLKEPLSQSFTPAAKRQTLTVNVAQIAAGALTDLSLTTDQPGDVMLAVTALTQVGKAVGFNEAVAVAAAPPVVAEPDDGPVTTAANMGAPPVRSAAAPAPPA